VLDRKENSVKRRCAIFLAHRAVQSQRDDDGIGAKTIGRRARDRR
jgi:hypothetical protein